MGQAKRRGSFEERKEKAVIRDDELFRLKVEKDIARRANMTEAERKAEHDYKMMLCSYMGFALSGLDGYLPYHLRR